MCWIINHHCLLLSYTSGAFSLHNLFTVLILWLKVIYLSTDCNHPRCCTYFRTHCHRNICAHEYMALAAAIYSFGILEATLVAIMDGRRNPGWKWRAFCLQGTCWPSTHSRVPSYQRLAVTYAITRLTPVCIFYLEIDSLFILISFVSGSVL
jgi:hypothetical protein